MTERAQALRPLPGAAPDPDAWWREGVVYEVYVRSLQDSDGDGVGDLVGIRRRLDHLEALGVDVLWLSPIFASPMADFGYDIADYCAIDPGFGTLDDFDALVADVHARGMRLLLDFVPNHTSDRHPWFVDSRSARHADMRDFYLWRDGAADGGPPNNWRSQFGGSAWTRDERTGQWFYHAFLAQQPDLNWRNPRVRAAMHDAMRFWLRRGVDGFRVDVIWHLIKDDAYRDNPPNPLWTPDAPEHHALLPVYTTDRPEVMDIVDGLRRTVAAFDSPLASRLLIGEIYLPIERLVSYYGRVGADARAGVQLPFNFHLIGTQWSATSIADLILRYEAALPGGAWPNWVLGNHDQSRIATRVGARQARLAAMLLLTLRGTPTIYYGDEIGMVDVAIAPDARRDPAGLREPGKGLGRDPQRTPMRWARDAGAGFTDGRPWLPVGPVTPGSTVDEQRADPGSMLTLYRALLGLRRREPALHRGGIEGVGALGDCLHYVRCCAGRRLLVVLNFGETPAPSPRAPVLLSTRDPASHGAAGVLEPGEGRILDLDGAVEP
ncbi:MAG: alpha-amylase family glycosyl hydrolase [Lautropia sp.]